jgi:hypothetical protein
VNAVGILNTVHFYKLLKRNIVSLADSEQILPPLYNVMDSRGFPARRNRDSRGTPFAKNENSKAEAEKPALPI